MDVSVKQLREGFYKNHTFKYLSVVINGFNKTDKNYLISNMSMIRAYAISDKDYEIAKREQSKYKLFILFNPKGFWVDKNKTYFNPIKSKMLFNNMLLHFRKAKIYFDDYRFYDMKEEMHVIVFSLPDIYHHAYDMFIQSNYSAMYNNTLKSHLFIDVYKTKPAEYYRYGVLNKAPDYKKLFVKQLNETFATSIEEKDIADDVEYDLPIKMSNEILNSTKYNYATNRISELV
jgi:hypothetical protein